MKCPICGKDNDCAISHGKDPRTCWCHGVEFPKKRLNFTSCICKECVEKLKRDELEKK